MKPAPPSPKPGATPANQSERHDDHRSVVVSALIIAGGTMLSRVLGLFRDMLTARYFSNDVRDAFVNAFRLPNLFRRIFGEGSLSVSFIPVFVGVLRGREIADSADPAIHRARHLASGVFTILLGATITLSLLAILFMDDILHVLLGGAVYMSVPGKFALTVDLARIMFAFLILISLYGFFMAVLNSLGKFAMTAVAPCFFNLALILAALLSPRVFAPIYLLAWAVIVGGLLQMAVLIPQLVKSGYLPKLSWDWRSPEIARVFKSVLPSAFGISILQITALVNMRFAAELESGSHSYLYLADRILELPLSLFVVSISSALLPTLSRFWADGDRDGMAETINHYMRLIIFVALPAAIGMFVLAQPIAEVLFMGREFKYAAAVSTANVIRVYAFAVVVVSGARILAQGFYAIQNTWFPAVAAFVTLIAHVFFAYALTRTFRLEGLAAASVVSSAVNLIMLATGYNAWVGRLQVGNFLRSLGKFVICGIAMTLVLQVYPFVSRGISGKFWGSRATALVVTIAAAGGVYMLCAQLLRVAELRESLSALREKLRKRLARA